MTSLLSRISQRPALSAAIALTVIGIVIAWTVALTSAETRAAKALMTSPPHSFTDPILTAFRITGNRASFTFWVKTPTGREFRQVVVDKKTGLAVLVD